MSKYNTKCENQVILLIKYTYVSKYNTKCENQVILLMTTDGEKWHYLTVKKLSVLVRGITSKHEGDLLLKLFSPV